MTTNAEQPAYPVLGHNTGLTKREYFAAMAMQGLLSNNYFLKEAESYLREKEILEGGNSGEYVAKKSLFYADYLLNQLENNKP